MRRLAAAIATAILVAGAAAVPASADEQSFDCPAQPNLIVAKMSERPVIYVHGWLGKADRSTQMDPAGPVQLLQKGLGSGYKVLGFDYSWANQEWGATKRTRSCLASYMREASRAFQASGGDGRILAVGHSMGGIAIRSAAGELTPANGTSNILAGVVTLATPHQGSPWGGTEYAAMYQKIKGYTGESTPLPEAGTSAALCLAWPRDPSCDSVPYLPEGTKVATVGTQIMMTKKLFDIPFVEGPTAEFPLFGDSIVPTISSNGYVLSAKPAPYPKGAFLGEERLVCKESSSYLSQRLIKGPAKFGIVRTIIATLAGTIVEEFIDMRALDTMMQGKVDVSQVSYVVLAMASECFHGVVPSNSSAVDAAAKYLRQMAPKGAASNVGQGSGTTAGPRQAIGGTADLSGHWSGAVYGAQSGYDLVLELKENADQLSGSVEYPQLKCSGTWTVTGRDEFEIRFDENITRNDASRCVKQVKVFLTRSVTGLHARITYNSREIQADLAKRG